MAKQKSSSWWRFQGSTRTLTTSLEGTGSATAVITSGGLPTLIVDLTSAQAAKYVDITDKIFGGLDVIDAYSIAGDTTAASCQVQKYDNSAASASSISNAIAKGTTDKGIVSAGTLDDAEWSFTDDDHVRLAITTAAYIGRVVIVFGASG
tara:strand:- start:6455 stop:6904 length:450 start_codon:yes stop_codon:yes gene_type:complete